MKTPAATVWQILLGLCLVVTARAAELPDLVDKVRPSVVGVGTAYPVRQPNRSAPPVVYHATGFVVGNGRQVITNAHAIPAELDSEHNQQLVIFAGRGADAVARAATEIRRDEKHDLALLEFRGPALPALVLGDSEVVREGQSLAFTGFPLGMVLGLYPATHRATVAAITPIARPMEDSRHLDGVQISRLRDPFLALQLDATAYPGNSGSPLFELERGQVVGVINGTIVKESRESMLSQPSGISYAIPAKYARALLRGR